MEVVPNRNGLRSDLLFIILAGLAIGTALAGCSGVNEFSMEHGPEYVTASPVTEAIFTDQVSQTSRFAASADARTDPRPVIACFGDSLTAGYGMDRDQSYPAVLQRRLDEAGFHYRVVNEGVSGDTTKDGLGRIGHVLAQKPQIVVLEFGGNDGLRGLPVTVAQRNIAAMIEQLQHGGARVALAGITVPPQYGSQYISQFNAMFPALARQYHLPLLPFLLQGVWGVEGDIQPDGVHPTAQGARRVAVNVQKLIEPMLKR
ncbi:MAG TPA: arylesterase [Acidobacteriaceae bacterium]|jgi:acyl-CoA thioesterase-1|nr:arylesterase [Acidobacteriaceae bacterium]